MKNKLLIALLALSLSACMGSGQHIQPIKTEYKVVMPEEKYFSGCDVVSLPDPSTLTDVQVAMLINDLVKTNRICHNNNQAIHDYLTKAKKELEARKN
jgi:hypothetical protein